MTKTAKQVVGDIIGLLNGSDLANSITGDIYRGGYRPLDSVKEDLIVNFTTGESNQIQDGIVALNIHVANIMHQDVYVENGQRCEEIEILAQEWVSSLNKGGSAYYFTLQQTIYTEFEKETNRHFVVVKLKYKLLTN